MGDVDLPRAPGVAICHSGLPLSKLQLLVPEQEPTLEGPGVVDTEDVSLLGGPRDPLFPATRIPYPDYAFLSAIAERYRSFRCKLQASFEERQRGSRTAGSAAPRVLVSPFTDALAEELVALTVDLNQLIAWVEARSVPRQS